MSAAVWVWVEHEAGRPRRVSLEILGKARALGLETVAAVLGHDAADVGRQVSRVADRVVVVEADALARYTAGVFADVLARLVAEAAPAALLAGATFDGRELLPRIAARLGAAFVGDCTDLAVDGAGLLARRAVHGGKVYAWLRPAAAPPAAITVRPNAFDLPAVGAPAPIETIAASLVQPLVRVVEVRRGETARPELTEADVVVTGGRGMGSPESFRLVEDLADALGGAVGASRAVVDAGWRPHGDQVGKSGKTVSPKLYVALGISGAIHHLMGMDTAKVVVAINKEPAAPIFKHADYGLVGDVHQVVPALVERLRRR
jgi:electron transfer flavoprotein alpha subunit